MRQNERTQQQIEQLRRQLNAYMDTHKINLNDNKIINSKIGSSQHFHAIALLQVIDIFEAHEPKQASDYARLHQQIKEFSQSAKAEKCFYENGGLIEILDTYSKIEYPISNTPKYSLPLSMSVSNCLLRLRRDHLQHRNAWQKLKSFFVGGFFAAQESVNLGEFKKEYQSVTDNIKTVQQAKKFQTYDAENFKKYYTQPLEERIKLLPQYKLELKKLILDHDTMIRVATSQRDDTISGQLYALQSDQRQSGNKIEFPKGDDFDIEQSSSQLGQGSSRSSSKSSLVSSEDDDTDDDLPLGKLERKPNIFAMFHDKEPVKVVVGDDSVESTADDIFTK